MRNQFSVHTALARETIAIETSLRSDDVEIFVIV